MYSLASVGQSSWINQIRIDPKSNNIYYEAVRLFAAIDRSSPEKINPCDEVLKVGDVAYLYNDTGDEHYVSKIVELFETPKGKKCCKCQWFYRPSDVPNSSKKVLELPSELYNEIKTTHNIESEDSGVCWLEGPTRFDTHPLELFLSNHMDINELKSIVRKCYVFSMPREQTVEFIQKDGAYLGSNGVNALEEFKKSPTCSKTFEHNQVPWHYCSLAYVVGSTPSKLQLLDKDNLPDINAQIADPANCPRPFPVMPIPEPPAAKAPLPVEHKVVKEKKVRTPSNINKRKPSHSHGKPAHQKKEKSEVTISHDDESVSNTNSILTSPPTKRVRTQLKYDFLDDLTFEENEKDDQDFCESGIFPETEEEATDHLSESDLVIDGRHSHKKPVIRSRRSKSVNHATISKSKPLSSQKTAKSNSPPKARKSSVEERQVKEFAKYLVSEIIDNSLEKSLMPSFPSSPGKNSANVSEVNSSPKKENINSSRVPERRVQQVSLYFPTTVKNVTASVSPTSKKVTSPDRLASSLGVLSLPSNATPPSFSATPQVIPHTPTAIPPQVVSVPESAVKPNATPIVHKPTMTLNLSNVIPTTVPENFVARENVETVAEKPMALKDYSNTYSQPRPNQQYYYNQAAAVAAFNGLYQSNPVTSMPNYDYSSSNANYNTALKYNLMMNMNSNNASMGQLNLSNYGASMSRVNNLSTNVNLSNVNNNQTFNNNNSSQANNYYGLNSGNFIGGQPQGSISSTSYMSAVSAPTQNDPSRMMSSYLNQQQEMYGMDNFKYNVAANNNSKPQYQGIQQNPVSIAGSNSMLYSTPGPQYYPPGNTRDISNYEQQYNHMNSAAEAFNEYQSSKYYANSSSFVNAKPNASNSFDESIRTTNPHSVKNNLISSSSVSVPSNSIPYSQPQYYSNGPDQSFVNQGFNNNSNVPSSNNSNFRNSQYIATNTNSAVSSAPSLYNDSFNNPNTAPRTSNQMNLPSYNMAQSQNNGMSYAEMQQQQQSYYQMKAAYPGRNGISKQPHTQQDLNYKLTGNYYGQQN